MSDLFLIEGNLEQYFTDFGLHFFLLPESGSKAFQISQIAVDRPRTDLFATSEYYKKYIEIWSEKTKETRSDCYVQGNATAGNLFLDFHHNPYDPLSEAYELPYPLFKEEELAKGAMPACMALKPHFEKISFSFFDDKGQTRGLSIFYRKDDPCKWMIALTANANQSPELTDAVAFTSFDPKPWSRKDGRCKISSEGTRDRFIKTIGSKKLASFMSQVIDENGNLNPNVKVLEHFLQSAGRSFETNDNLMNKFNEDLVKNEVLIKLAHHATVKAPVASVERCLDKKSQLYQSVSSYELTGNKDQDQRHLGWLLFIDEYNLWEKQDILLKDGDFAQSFRRLLNIITDPSISKFLVSCLDNDQKVSSLKFLMKAPQDPTNLIEELSKIPGDRVWKELKQLEEDSALENTKVSNEALSCFLDLQKIQAMQDQFGILTVTEQFKKVPVFRKEMARSIDYLAEKKAVKEDYRTLLTVFVCLPPEAELNEKTTTAFLALYWEMDPKPGSHKAEKIINDLINNAPMASAMADVADQGVKIAQLYANRETPSNTKIIQALNKIAKAVPASLGASFYELAMKHGVIGADFCELINNFLSDEGCKLLIECLAEEIQNRKALGQPDADNVFYEFYFDVFYALSREIEFTSLLPKMAKVGFALCKENNANIQKVKETFYYLIENPQSISTIERTMAFNLPVSQYYLSPKVPFNAEIIATFQKITEVSSAAKRSFELAMKNDEVGRGFRRLLNSSSAKKFVTPLIQFVLEDIHARKLSGDQDASEKDYQKLFNFFALLPADAEMAKIDQAKIKTPFLQACFNLCQLVEPNDAIWDNFALLLNSKLPAAQKSAFPLIQLFLIGKGVPKVAEELTGDPEKLHEMQEDIAQKNHDFERLEALVPQDPSLIKFIREGIYARRLTKYPASSDLKSCRERNVQVNLDGLDQLLVTVNQLRDLGLDEKVIDFMLNRKDKKANDFYRIVRKLEHQSSLILQELPKNNKAYEQFPEKEKQYRRDLLKALYYALNSDKEMTQKRKFEEFTVRVKAAEARIVKPLLKADDDPVLRKIAQFFVNMATIVLTIVTGGTFGYAHYRHHQRTGDLLFYSSPKPVEDYKTLNHEILEDVRENMTDDPKPKK